MATKREKKFILEFDAPEEYGCERFHNYEIRYCRVAIAQHPQKNKFPNLYAVYCWVKDCLGEHWSKRYYYDREQQCFFRPYRMQYIETTDKTAIYIRDKLIAFFSEQQEAAKAQTTQETTTAITDEQPHEDIKPYQQNYEHEHRMFIMRVKNGHVPQSVLADMKPEE